MSFLDGIAGSVGPAAPVLENIFGSVAGSVGSKTASAAGPMENAAAAMEKAMQSMQDAFASLFGRPPRTNMPSMPLRPPAFGNGFIQNEVAGNPMQSLLPLQSPFQQAGNVLQNLANQYPALQTAGTSGSNPFAAAAATGDSTTLDGIINAGDLKFLDQWQEEIEKLMISQNPSDQIKAQMKMNQLNRIVDMITTVLTKQRDIQSKIAQNMAR